MTIAIVAPTPPFGAAYNIRDALNATLICDKLDGWREWQADVLLDSARGINQARKVIRAASHVLIITTWGLKTWAKIGIEHERKVLFLVETRIDHEPSVCLSEIRRSGIEHLFHLPNLTPYMPDHSVAMLQPVAVPETCPEKALDGPTVILHTPGTLKKRVQKGSDAIRRVVDDLSAIYPIAYTELLHVSHADTLRARAGAHICIDQVPPPGYPRGLGLSGEESLAHGCATVSTLYPQGYAPHYPWPPVYDVTDEATLKERLAMLLDQPRERLIRRGREAHAWAANYLAPEFWASFYWAHLPGAWAIC